MTGASAAAAASATRDEAAMANATSFLMPDENRSSPPRIPPRCKQLSGRGPAAVEKDVAERSPARGDERLVPFVDARHADRDQHAGDRPSSGVAALVAARRPESEGAENAVAGKVSGLAEDDVDRLELRRR